MIHGSLLLLAFLGPAQALFLPEDGPTPAFRSVSGGVVLDAEGMRVGDVRVRFTPTTSPYGVQQEGSFRFVGRGKVRTLPSYRAVMWRAAGETVKVTGMAAGSLEIQFLLDPGNAPDAAFLSVDRGRFVSTPNGIALVHHRDTLLRLTDFRAYQGIEEKTLYVHVESQKVRFDVPAYDPTLPLVIDPITAVITGSDTVEVRDVKVSVDGNSVYAAGVVYSYPDVNFSVNPVLSGTSNSPGCGPPCTDAFITHLSADLSTHYQTVVLASSFQDEAMDLAVESTFVAVAGWSAYSYNFAASRTVWGTQGGPDAFVVVMDSALSQVLHTFIVATPDSDQFWAVDFDEYAHVYAGGFTRDGNNVPASVAPNIFGTVSGRDGLIAMFSMDPAPTLMSSAVLAGTTGTDEEVDDLLQEPAGGALYATGQTTAGAAFAGGGGTTYGSLGSRDAFITSHFNALVGLSAVVFGTGADEYSRRIAASPGWSRIYVAGYTSDALSFQTDFSPVIHGPAPTGFGASFVVRGYAALNPDTVALVTGASGNGATGLVVTADRVALAGKVYNPQTFAPARQIYGALGGPDAYLTVLDTSLTLHLGSAVLASSGLDQAYGLDLSSQGFVVGGFTGAPSNFAENPPSYFYGNGNTGRRGFVSLIPGAQVGVREPSGQGTTTARRVRVRVVDRVLWITTPEAGYLALEVVDQGGRVRLRRIRGYMPAGTYREALRLPPGTYLLRLRSGDHVGTRKLLIP